MFNYLDFYRKGEKEGVVFGCEMADQHVDQKFAKDVLGFMRSGTCLLDMFLQKKVNEELKNPYVS